MLDGRDVAHRVVAVQHAGAVHRDRFDEPSQFVVVVRGRGREACKGRGCSASQACARNYGLASMPCQRADNHAPKAHSHLQRVHTRLLIFLHLNSLVAPTSICAGVLIRGDSVLKRICRYRFSVQSARQQPPLK